MADTPETLKPTKPPGFKRHWLLCHLLVALFAAVLAKIGLWRLLEPGLPEPFQLLADVTPVAACVIFLCAPILPKIRGPYRDLVERCLEGLCWVVLKAYDGVYLIHRSRRKCMRVILLGAILGIPAIPVVAVRYATFSQTQQGAKQLFEKCWNAMIEFVCDDPLDAGAQRRFDGYHRLMATLPPDLDPRSSALDSIDRVLNDLYQPIRGRIRFTDHCAEIAAKYQGEDVHAHSHPELYVLLRARLYIRGSQNGVYMPDVIAAQALLEEGLVYLPQSPSTMEETRIWVAYRNYLGVVHKLRTQWYSKRRRPTSDARSSDMSSDRAALFAKAYEYYEQARKMAEEHSLGVALGRVQNNLVDWNLLLFASVLDRNGADSIDPTQLPAALRPRWNSLENPESLVRLIEQQLDDIERNLQKSLMPAFLVTMAQTECLLATAKLRLFGDQDYEELSQVDRSTIKPHLRRALHSLKIAIYSFDEADVLKHLDIFHLSALVEMDDAISEEFNALRNDTKPEWRN